MLSPLAMWVVSCLGLSPGRAVAPGGGPGGLQPAQGAGTPELLAQERLWPWPRLQPCAASVLSEPRGFCDAHRARESHRLPEEFPLF